MPFVIQTRTKPRRAAWSDWEPVCPETFSADEVAVFASELTPQDFDILGEPVQYRAVDGCTVLPIERPCGLEPEPYSLPSRHLPSHIHALNDRVLTALGV